MTIARLKTRSLRKDGHALRRITQRSGTSCGVACVAMLSHLDFKEVFEASKELWGDDCWDDSHRTTIPELRELLDSLGWKLGRKTKGAEWNKVPPQALVAVQFKADKDTWHWVITDQDDEGLFILDPRPSVKREKRRDLKKLPLAWYHRVTPIVPDKPQWEVDLDREYADVSEWIKNLHPDLPHTADADAMWLRYVEYAEKTLIKRVEREVNKPQQARKLVRRGWAIADFKNGRFIAALKLEDGDHRPSFPAVLHNTGSGWHLPPLFTLCLQLHPKVSQLKRDQKPLSPEEQFWKELNSAKALRTSSHDWDAKDHQGNMLAQAAEGVDLMLETAEGEIGFDWVRRANESDAFWSLVSSLVTYGRRSILHDLYRVGNSKGKSLHR